MDYQEQLQYAKKKRKKIAIISVIILIFMTFIIGIIGGLNKEERTEKLVEELSGSSFEGSIVSAGTPYKWKFNFEEDCTGEIYSEYVSEYSGFNSDHGHFNYSINYDYFGIEYVVMDIKWDDGEASQWELEIGKNNAGEILVLGRTGEDFEGYIRSNESITEDITYDNVYLKYILVILIIAVCIINSIAVWDVFAIKRKYKKEEQRKDKEKEQEKVELKRQLLIKMWNEEMSTLNYNKEDSVKVSNSNWLWVANGNLYEAEDVNIFVRRYLDDNLEKYATKYSYIPVSNIQCFSKEGDVHYTTRISGGGGGGSSIKGAIVGGLLAGETGAVIGSRKKVNEIKSESITHDSRKTLIRYYHKDELLNMSYVGFDVYNYLLKKIPEKDLLSMQLNGDNKQKATTETNINNIEEKMLTIKKLYETGLISKEEFEEKRAELLTKI